MKKLYYYDLVDTVIPRYRIIKMSSPNINSLMLLGCVIMYVVVFLQDRGPSVVEILCKVKHLLSITKEGDL